MMTDFAMTLTIADYARIMPLAMRQVKPEGIDLTLEMGRGGSWPERAEMLRRALQDDSVAGGEASLGGHLRRIDQGDRSYVALPVFVLRNFTARDLYVRQGSGLSCAADLNGKRIGMYNWVASGSVWYRHFLRHEGVDLDSIAWTIGDIDAPHASTHKVVLPAGVSAPPPGRSLSAMLIDGELDAIYSPPRPAAYDAANGPLVRLYKDVRAVEQAYFKATGVFPPQHLMVLRRAVWEANPSVLRSLTDAFIAANDLFDLAQRRFPYATPWLDNELDDTASVMGTDFHPHGLDRNRSTLQAFCDQAHAAALTDRRVVADEMFSEFLQG
jgi:4,5-dihydroxyphthalate decarboxylase